MATLFEAARANADITRPLADRMRPTGLAQVVGQDHLIGRSGPIGRMIEAGKLTSMILWGPPGSGKTTIARLLAHQTEMEFCPLSAVFSGVGDLRKLFTDARIRRADGQGTLLFVDEIHRFNRAQQDAFLPYVEDGTVILVGATTENPSFELIPALLSRCHVFVLHRLDDLALEKILEACELLTARGLPLTDEARISLKAMADGDGRFLLNLVEALLEFPENTKIDDVDLASALQKRAPLYDKGQDNHYNLISALHKSLRGSDVDAALYWLARMLVGGEEPLYIVRRLVRFASEDIGLADPQALLQALAAKEAYEFIGSPEGELALAQCVIFLATAPKSNASYRAFNSAIAAAQETGSLMPPKHILNAPTRLMKDLGYGRRYAYDHNESGAFSGQNYFPEELDREIFYAPSTRGYEGEVKKRLQYWARLRAQKDRRSEEKD